MKFNVKKLNEKQNLEFYAAANFIKLIRQTGLHIKMERFGIPPEPDVICKILDDVVGIEIAHLYGSERDARLIHGRSRKEEMEKKSRLEHSLIPLSYRLPEDLSRILCEKSRKSYPCKTILLIRNAYPLWNKNTFESYSSEIKIPKDHSFEEIWLLCGRDYSSGMIKYYSKKQ